MYELVSVESIGQEWWKVIIKTPDGTRTELFEWFAGSRDAMRLKIARRVKTKNQQLNTDRRACKNPCERPTVGSKSNTERLRQIEHEFLKQQGKGWAEK